MNRTELAIAHLEEEWDVVVVLCSQYDAESGATYETRYIKGNALAAQKMIENEAELHMFGSFEEEDDGTEEEEAEK